MEIIDISQKLDEFHEHLKHNPRTILSAKFGDGKTFFLNEYFAKHQIWKDYTPIEERVGSSEDAYFVVLHPVNYSVAKNEDIFEYIKRDILIQLYQEGGIDDIDYKAVFKAIKEELKEKALPMLGELVSLIPGGKIAKSIIDLGVGIKKTYDEEKQTAADFLDTFVKQKGGIYEDDAYTQMIRKTLEHLKEPHEELSVRKVLVIEDLDRLDPGHLFRILNVLGAHIDDDKSTNKFGFDNIVLVLDYEVTESIFHHFYGENANYTGYMAKFITGNPFYYSIKGIAIEYLCNIIRNRHHQMIIQTVVQKKKSGAVLVEETLYKRLGTLSIRDIEKLIDHYTQLRLYDTVQFMDYTISTDTPIVSLISFLVLMNGECSRYNFEEWLKKQDNWYSFLGGFVYACVDYHGAYSDGANHRRSFMPIKNDEGIITMVNIREDNSGQTIVPNKEQIIHAAILAAQEVVLDGKALKW